MARNDKNATNSQILIQKILDLFVKRTIIIRGL